MKCFMFTPAHKQSNAQPVSKQQAPCKRTPLGPSVSIALYYKVWAIPLATFGQLFQLCPFPASFPSTAFLKCGGNTKSWLWAVQAVFSYWWTLVCYQQCFGLGSKTEQHTGCYEETGAWKLTLCQPDSGLLTTKLGLKNFTIPKLENWRIRVVTE